MSQETVAAQDMLNRFVQRQGRKPASIAADATYGNGEFLQWLLDRGITVRHQNLLRTGKCSNGSPCAIATPEVA